MWALEAARVFLKGEEVTAFGAGCPECRGDRGQARPGREKGEQGMTGMSGRGQ